jgi:hypothetical protein
MAIAEIEVSKKRIVEKTLQYDILVTSRSGIVDATQTIGSTRCCDCVCGDVAGVLFAGVCEELVMFPLAPYHEECK